MFVDVSVGFVNFDNTLLSLSKVWLACIKMKGTDVISNIYYSLHFFLNRGTPSISIATTEILSLTYWDNEKDRKASLPCFLPWIKARKAGSQPPPGIPEVSRGSESSCDITSLFSFVPAPQPTWFHTKSGWNNSLGLFCCREMLFLAFRLLHHLSDLHRGHAAISLLPPFKLLVILAFPDTFLFVMYL